MSSSPPAVFCCRLAYSTVYHGYNGDVHYPLKPRWRATLGYTFADNQLEFWNGEEWEVVSDVTNLYLTHVPNDFTQIVWTMFKTQTRFGVSTCPVEGYHRLMNGNEVLDVCVDGGTIAFTHEITVSATLDDVEVVIDRYSCLRDGQPLAVFKDS